MESSELKQAFCQSIERKSISLNLRFFIDGLDKFRGDPLDFLQPVVNASSIDNVRLCVSSSPLPRFEMAFEGRPKLASHDLTFDDIKTYVADGLKAGLRL